jgi:hypothetical protein
MISNSEETIQLRTILHLFQCLPFCLSYGKPYKGERDRCRYRVKSVSAGETDSIQQQSKRDGDGEIRRPIGGARNGKGGSSNFVGKHFA